MKTSIYKLLFIILVSTLFLSCSENTVTDEEDNSDNLFPLTVAPTDYWIFERLTLDSNNKIDNDIPPINDSAFVAGTEPRLNRQAHIYRYKRIKGSGKPLPDQYFYKEGNKIWAHSDIITNFTGFDQLPINLPIKFDEQWFLWIDPSSSNWKIAEKKLTNDTIVIPNQAILVLNGKIELYGEGKGKETIKIKIKNKNHKAHKYTMSLVFDVKVTIIINNIPVPGEIKFTRRIHYWYVNNLGCVRQLLETVKYNVPLVGLQTFLGFDATVVDYSVIPKK